MIKQQKIQEINKIWSKARVHAQASKIGKPIDNQYFQVCQCCDQVIQKQPIPMCEHTKQFEVYGFGYPLWFSFLKYCIVLILVLIASKTASQLYMATRENHEFCYGKMSYKDSKINQNNMNKLENKHYNINEIEHDYLRKNIIQNYNIFKKQIEEDKQILQNAQNILENQSNNPGGLLSFKVNSKVQIKCTSFMVYLSIFKGQDMYQNLYLRFVQFFIHLICLIGIRNMILKQEQYYDQRTTLISNYSLIINHLPYVYGIKEKVKKMFEQQFSMKYGQDENAQIKDMICIFKDQKLKQLNEEIQALEKQKLQLQKQKQQDKQKKLEQINTQILNVKEILQDQIDQVRLQIQKDQILCQKMIIIMRSQADKANVLEEFSQAIKNKKNFQQYFDGFRQKGRTQIKLLIKQAQQPNQIIWENFDLSDTYRKTLILQGWVLTFIFLSIITIIFYFFMLAKTQLILHAAHVFQQDPNNEQAKLLHRLGGLIVFVAMMTIVLFNKFIMGKILHYFVHLEKHAFIDKQSHSFASKYAIGMFFTTAIMTLAVEAITFNNFYAHQYGVIEQQTIMFFITAFLIPLIWLINPFNLFHILRRKRYQDTLINQKQANEISQNIPYDLGKRYAEVFQIMWFTFLYCQLIPLGSILSLIGLFLYYWVDKYNFLRRSSIKSRVSGKMAILGLKSLDITLLLTPTGQFVFRGIIRNQIDYFALICMVIAIIYLISPISKIIWWINGQNFLISQKTFDQAKQMFKQTYYNLHPIYKLTHKKQNEKHRQMVRQYIIKDIKKVKHYGTGRGTYRRHTTTQRSFKKQSQYIPNN